ncbi:MAG: hypothetical protein HUU21_07675 [Polyangiaceae bacterium]|nr:hypothetical protein [Polyangiaceae bacterium]
MLRIRTEQLEALRAPALDDFIDEMMLHVHEYFPKESMALGLAAVRERIEDGIKKAEAHGVTSPRGVCKYINMMMTFSPDFDTHPDTAPWVCPILDNPEIPDGTARMDLLSDKALAILDEAEGDRTDEQQEMRSP